VLPDPAAHSLLAIVASNPKVAHSATIWMRTARLADLEADAAQAQALAQIAAATASSGRRARQPYHQLLPYRLHD